VKGWLIARHEVPAVQHRVQLVHGSDGIGRTLMRSELPDAIGMDGRSEPRSRPHGDRTPAAKVLSGGFGDCHHVVSPVHETCRSPRLPEILLLTRIADELRDRC
jgi:hypothetical protein